MRCESAIGIFILAVWAAGIPRGMEAAPRRKPGPRGAHSAALPAAITAWETGTVLRLLARGADPNARDAGGTPVLNLAVRALAHDSRMIRALLDAGADVNAPDRRGIRPLLLAPFYGDPAAIRLLLERGAAVNAVDPNGRTALMVAAGRGAEEIVTLLLEKGADVNRVSRAGDTALLLAIRARKPRIVRALLEQGAALAPDGRRDTSLVAAAEAGEPATAELLLRRGADVNAADEYGDTPLLQAARAGASGVARTLLEHGAAVQAGNAAGETPLLAASRSGSVELIRLLLARGAVVNARDRHGASPLLLATVREHLPAARLLLEHGANPRTEDGRGRSVLQRAAALSNAAIVAELSARGAGETPVGDEPALRRTAVESGLSLLQRSGAVFREKTRNVCYSCHHQSLPVMALALARARGIGVDAGELRAQVRHVEEAVRRNTESYRSGVGVPGQVSVAGYALWTLQVGEARPDESTRAVVDYLLRRDRKLGYWRAATLRPPAGGSAMSTTYVALRSLRAFAEPAHAPRVAARVAAARQWLARAPAKDTEDRVFRLWALHLAGAPRAEVEGAVRELLATQREDGGWAQLPGMTSDAYATGTALVALHATGGLAAADPPYGRGVRFLLRTQEEDGSWFVRTRAAPLQPFFESGFPHGRSQYISATATGWALWALLLTFPEVPSPAPASLQSRR